MAITQINITDITNGSIVNNAWEGTGIFDALMTAVNKNVEIQYNSGRITGTDYANVYLASLQAVLQQSVDFALRQKLTEEQIALAYTDRVIKDKEAAALGLDGVVKTLNNSPTAVYTPHYEKL